MIIPDYKLLFEPYSKDGCDIKAIVKWLINTCLVKEDIAEIAIAETMMEMASGKDFLGPCECGCGISPQQQRAHTRINHYIRDKAWAIQTENDRIIADRMEQREKARILSHIQADNKAYTESKMKPRWYSNVWKKLNEPL